MNQKDISVIVTTRNEENHIEECLKSILNQNYPPGKIEIIIVDNNSTDRTKEIAAHYTKNIFNVGPERSAQRNFGVEKSTGKYILYLDADMILSETVLRECFYKCENEGFSALYIPEIIVGEGFWIKVRNFERGFYNATCIDGVRFIRRDIFLQIGGFDLSLTGPEDWDLNTRINQNGLTGIIDSPLYHNEGAFNLKIYLRKKAYYAHSFDTYIEKWGRGDPIIKKQLGFRYRYIGVFTENGKWKRLVRHPVLAKGMYLLRFMVGMQYLKNRGKSK
ncbi:glycosyltransferase [Candidatus Latescibacterota bacterium]